MDSLGAAASLGAASRWEHPDKTNGKARTTKIAINGLEDSFDMDSPKTLSMAGASPDIDNEW